MKVLQINNFHHLRGGSDRVYLETGQQLQDRGHQVLWFSGAHAANIETAYSQYFPPTVDLTRLHPLDLPKYIHNRNAAIQLDRLIQNHGRPDIAHLHIYHGGLTPAILPVLRKHRVPIVQTAHEYKLACPVYTLEHHGRVCHDCVDGSRLNLLRNKCKNDSFAQSAALFLESTASRLQGDARLIDRIICISAHQRSILQNAGLPKDKLSLCHNGVDTQAFSPCDADEKQDYFLYFGRIEELKGVPTLVKAAQRSGVSVKFAGKGNWAGPLTQAISGNPNLSYLGKVVGTDLTRLISQAKAVIVPSEWEEPFGLTVLEAMACGTAVIAARSGGIPELIRPGVDGQLFDAGQVDQLAALLQQFGTQDAIDLGAVARTQAVTRFDQVNHIDSVLRIYKEVINHFGHA